MSNRIGYAGPCMNIDGVQERFNEMRESLGSLLSNEVIATLVVADILQGIEWDIRWLVCERAEDHDLDADVLPG